MSDDTRQAGEGCAEEITSDTSSVHVKTTIDSDDITCIEVPPDTRSDEEIAEHVKWLEYKHGVLNEINRDQGEVDRIQQTIHYTSGAKKIITNNPDGTTDEVLFTKEAMEKMEPLPDREKILRDLAFARDHYVGGETEQLLRDAILLLEADKANDHTTQ